MFDRMMQAVTMKLVSKQCHFLYYGLSLMPHGLNCISHWLTQRQDRQKIITLF